MLEDAAHNIASSEDGILSQTLDRLFVPVTRLCLDHGMTYAAAEEALKRSFVQEAVALHPAEHGMVSRISAATGINRREVTRLVKAKAPRRSARQPLAAEIIARWTTDKTCRDQDGAPLPLKRQGAAPSFESLAQSVTRDVHPRSLLEELIRLGVVRHDAETDQVQLSRSEYVPEADTGAMLALLADNVGDHLAGAVANVLGDGAQHHEQAVFGDELSEASVKALAPLIMNHWQGLRDALVPAMTGLIEADRQAGRPQDQRVRIGLYSFAESTAPPPAPHAARGGRRRTATTSTKENQ